MDYYLYCVLFDKYEVAHTPVKDSQTTVRIEEKGTGKWFECIIPIYITSNCGFSQDEVNFLREFCEANVDLLLKYGQQAE